MKLDAVDLAIVSSKWMSDSTGRGSQNQRLISFPAQGENGIDLRGSASGEIYSRQPDGAQQESDACEDDWVGRFDSIQQTGYQGVQCQGTHRADKSSDKHQPHSLAYYHS